MSLAIVYSRASMGVQAPLVTIEVHLSNGKPGFTLVGLPEKTVKEAQDRVRSALMNAQFKYPAKRITVNLAPADLPKEGGRFDLPIAIGILAASDQLDGSRLKQFEFVGELALTGELRGAHGVIPAILAAQKAKRAPIIAYQNANEASLVSEQETYFAKNLLEVVQFLNNQEKVRRYVRAIFRLVWEWFLHLLRQGVRHYDVALEKDVVSSYENLIHFVLNS